MFSRERFIRSLLVAFYWMWASTQAHAVDWHAVKVLADGRPETYTPLPAVTKPWRVCALLPHGQDKFWWGVSWGLAEEAKRLDIKLGIYEAGGYANLDTQKQQFADCLAHHANAILLSAVSPSGLNEEIEEAARKNVPVIDMINGIKGEAVTGHALGQTAQLAELSAQYILANTSTRPISVAWFPGPQGADWVEKADSGMRSVLKPNVAKIVEGGYDLPEPTKQMTLIRSLFSKQTPDYVLANSVAAVDAARFVGANRALHTKVVAWYANEPVVEMIRNGQILAAACNSPVLQARIALDLALRKLEGKPHPKTVKVQADIIDTSNVNTFPLENLFAPPGTWMIRRPLPD